MKIVFVTRMGNTDELVRQKLGYTDAMLIVDGSEKVDGDYVLFTYCLLYTSPSPRDTERSRMPSSA